MSLAVSVPLSSIEFNGDAYSPAKQKAINRGSVASSHRCVRRLLSPAWSKPKLVFILVIVCFVTFFMVPRRKLVPGRSTSLPFSSVSPSFAIIINSWRRNSLLKQTVSHYTSCRGVGLIHVLWPDADSLEENLKADFVKGTPKVVFQARGGNRFKPIAWSGAVFSVDDGVIVPCSDLELGFQVWQTAHSTMVGFVPRMHWFDYQVNGNAFFKYGGWFSVWWTGTYSMVLAKAAFFHSKYLNLYTTSMSSSIQEFVSMNRKCEDIAFSMLIANVSGSPPIWVKGNLHEIGYSGRSDGRGYEWRSGCLNDLISLFGFVPLKSNNLKAVDSNREWFW